MPQILLLFFYLINPQTNSANNLDPNAFTGTWALAYTHANGQFQAAEPDGCGYYEILEIDPNRWNEPSKLYGHEVILKGRTAVWVCHVNPETYNLGIQWTTCFTFFYHNQKDPNIWLIYGGFGCYKMRLEVLQDQLFISFLKLMEDHSYDHHLFGQNQTIVYRKISDQPFRTLLKE